MNAQSLKPEVTVLVVIAPHTVIERIDRELKEAGITTETKTRKRGVPLAGAVFRLENIRSIRQDAVPIVKRIISGDGEEKDRLCTASFFSFFPDLEYGESCLIWSDGFMARVLEKCSQEKHAYLEETNGMIFTCDYSVPKNTKTHREERNDGYIRDAKKFIRDMCGNTELPITQRGLVLSSSLNLPFVVWTDGNGSAMIVNEKKALPSLAEIAYMDKGYCSRALEYGFVAWTHENMHPWFIPGTLGPGNRNYIKAVTEDNFIPLGKSGVKMEGRPERRK